MSRFSWVLARANITGTNMNIFYDISNFVETSNGSLSKDFTWLKNEYKAGGTSSLTNERFLRVYNVLMFIK